MSGVWIVKCARTRSTGQKKRARDCPDRESASSATISSSRKGVGPFQLPLLQVPSVLAVFLQSLLPSALPSTKVKCLTGEIPDRTREDTPSSTSSVSLPPRSWRTRLTFRWGRDG